MSITQRNIFLKRSLSFEDNGLNCIAKGLTGDHEIFIPYEEILIVKIIKQSRKNRTMLLITGFFILLLAMNLLVIAFGENNYDSWGGTIVLFLFSLASFCIYYYTGSNEILIPTTASGHIILFRDKPNKIAVENFINELKNKINYHLLQKYGQIDKDLPIEPQLNNLMWLQEREILSKEDFQSLKSKLLDFKPTNESIGFKSSN